MCYDGLMKRFVILLISVVLLAGCSTVKIGNDTGIGADRDGLPGGDDITTMNLGYMAENTDVVGYLARPKGSAPEGRWPALILIHEWWGLNDNIRGLAEDFAREGYVALAVDLYEGKSTDNPTRAREMAGGVRDDMDRAFANLKAAVDYLKSLDYVADNQLASVGWCFGGGWSYQMAKNDLGVQASVMYYGQFMPEDDLEQMRAQIIGHFGEDDQSIPVDDVKAFEAKLQTLDGEHEVYIYENAGHAFANEDNEQAYREESAREAWERTMRFLEKAL